LLRALPWTQFLAAEVAASNPKSDEEETGHANNA